MIAYFVAYGSIAIVVGLGRDIALRVTRENDKLDSLGAGLMWPAFFIITVVPAVVVPLFKFVCRLVGNFNQRIADQIRKSKRLK